MQDSVSGLRFAICQVCLLGCLISPVLAQIIPDATLGAERSRLNSGATVRGRRAERIEGGAKRGGNLFHSFEAFNVREGQRVYFGEPSGIENIFSRVTGSGLSEILGTLGVEGQANLFLINPNGILFGPNARLDIRGSFIASTADRVMFADGSEFSVINPQASPLLTVSVPVGLQGVQLTGNIINQGSLNAGRDLSLIGANLDLQGRVVAGRDLNLQAQNILRIRDSTSNPFVAASGRQMIVQGNQTIDLFALNHSNSGLVAGQDMVLRSANPVSGDAHYWSGGQFRIEQLDGNLGGLISLYDPVIRSLGDVSFDSYRGASLHIIAAGQVTVPGEIVITSPDTINGLAETIVLSDGTPVQIDGRSRATLDVRAGVSAAAIGLPIGLIGTLADLPNLNTADIVASDTRTISSADITINEILTIGNAASDGLVLLTNQYNPNSALLGSIEVGQIITAVDSGAGVVGNSGSVILDSRNQITVRPDGRISTASRNARSGEITLLAGDTIWLDNAKISSFTVSPEDAGNIRIQTGSLVLSNTALISTSTTGGRGNSGSLSITARDTIQLSDSALVTAASSLNPITLETVTNVGNGGNLTIQTGQLHLQNLSAISTGTDGRSESGNLFIQADSVLLSNLSLMTAFAYGGGAGGNIAIQTGDLLIQGKSGITTLSVGQGNAGNISIQADDRVSVVDGGSGISTSSLGSGTGGQILIETDQLNIQNSAGIFTSAFDPATFSTEVSDFTLIKLLAPEAFVRLLEVIQDATTTFQQGDSGDINIRARESVNLGGIAPSLSAFASGALLSTFATGRASGGDLFIETPQLVIQPGGLIRTDIAGSGRAGSLQVRQAETIEVAGGRIAAETDRGSTGIGGNISLETLRLQVREGGSVTSSTSGDGNAGNLTITNANRVDVVGQNAFNEPSLIAAQVNTGASGSGGNLTIETDRLTIRDSANVSVSTAGAGRGGNLSVRGNQGTAERVMLVNGGSLSAQSTSAGDAGSLTVAAEVLSLQNNATISASTLSSQGGDIRLRDLATIQIDNSEISASTQSGKAGNITVDAADTVRLNRQGRLSVAATQRGSAGNLIINTDQLLLEGVAEATVSSTGTGRAGSLTIAARDIQLQNSQLAAKTEAGGGANIDLQVETLNLENSQISASTRTGQGGRISLNTDRLPASQIWLTDNSRISTQATRTGNGGNLTLNSQQLTVENNSAVTASARSGQSGNVILQGLETLQIVNGGRVSASTQEGQAGNVRINSTEAIRLRNQGRLSVEASALGTAGNLVVRTSQLTVEDDSEVTVSSPRGQAGSLIITADAIDLNRGRLTARTGLSRDQEGANLQLQVADQLYLRNSSLISAEATGSASGGNITINADDGFVFADPNQDNDLIARATQGRGGNIQITTQGIFGITEGLDRSGINTNDIDASSQFGTAGNITIDLTSPDPTQGLGELPIEPVDVAGLIDQNLCEVSRGSEFVITGQGGLPPTPNESLSHGEVWEDWRLTTITEPVGESIDSRMASIADGDRMPMPTNTPELVEAQGWKMDAAGSVTLLAEVAQTVPHPSWKGMLNCQTGEQDE